MIMIIERYIALEQHSTQHKEIMMSSRLITPERQNKCERRLMYGDCSCCKAKFSYPCNNCHKRMHLGDCIFLETCGWTHKECPIGHGMERGLKTIEAGFNNSVDYGSSFLRRIATDDVRIPSLPSPRRLEFEEEEDSKMPASSGSKRPVEVTQDDFSRGIPSLPSPRRLEFEEEAKMPASSGSKRSAVVIQDDFSQGILSLPSPCRLEFEEEEDSKMPASPGSKRSAVVTQDDFSQEADECSQDHSHESDEVVFSKQPACKKAKHEDNESSGVAGITNDYSDAGKYADEMRTNEQMAILSHEPEVGDVVVVNALAGCGKTTTISLLCNRIHEENPRDDILYLVYNSSMGEDAMQSNKFPKSRMEIRTSHAYVLRHFFGVDNMRRVAPTGEYKLEDIIEELDLTMECKRIFQPTLKGGHMATQILEKRVKTIAGYVRRTVSKFQASSDQIINGDHVFWRAKEGTNLTTRTKWRKEIQVIQYQRWAWQFFCAVHRKCMNIKSGEDGGSAIGITHDGYLKVAQMEKLIIPYDYLFIDEAQDMSACQADLFWGQYQRQRKIIYLFGDRYQQIYRFRGASRAFRDMVDASNPKFTLTGSFRFGLNIASCATCVLKALGAETLHGRSNDQGSVEEVDGHCTMNRVVVLCRTQNGIFRYLHANRPARWCDLSGKCNIPKSPKPWQLDLETFLKGLKDLKDQQDDDSGGGEALTFTYKGETFQSVRDILEYIDDEGDNDLLRALTLLKYLVDQDKSIDQFYSELRSSFYPMQHNESPDEYNGVVMTTVHKAKGLEFSCVLINDDFHFKAIQSAVVNKDRHCDEANLLYVAITRAKHRLCLTEGVKNCLQKLSELDHVQVQLPSMNSLKSSREKLASWQHAWKSFEESSDLIESIDIMYPPEWNNDEYPFVLHPAMSVPEQKKQLWRFLLIYHPDKFFPKFGGRIQSATVEDGIKDILEEITRKCTEFLVSLRCEEED